MFVMVAWLCDGIACDAQINTGVCHGFGAISTEPFDCENSPFVLVFEDEFNGSALDGSKWNALSTIERDKDVTTVWNKPENIIVENGMLRIQMKADPGIHQYVTAWTDPPTYAERFFPYSSGEIQTVHRYGEGYYEASVRIPSGGGLFWPSFWLYGENAMGGNEIDIFEFWGNDQRRWRTNVHRNNSTNCGVHFIRELATEFRTYILQWDQHNILWKRGDTGTVRNFPRWSTYLGQVMNCATLQSGNSGPVLILNSDYPTHPPVSCNIILSLGQRIEDNSPPIDVSIFPRSMDIESVRYYRRVPCMGDAVVSNYTSLNNSNGEYNFCTARKLTCEESFVVPSDGQIEASCTRSCTLLPGFDAKYGSLCLFRLGPSNCGSVAVPEIDAMNTSLNNGISHYSKAENNVVMEENVGDEALGHLEVSKNHDGYYTVNGLAKGGVLSLYDVLGRQLKYVHVGSVSVTYELSLDGIGTSMVFIVYTGPDGMIRTSKKFVAHE